MHAHAHTHTYTSVLSRRDRGLKIDTIKSDTFYSNLRLAAKESDLLYTILW